MLMYSIISCDVICWSICMKLCFQMKTALMKSILSSPAWYLAIAINTNLNLYVVFVLSVEFFFVPLLFNKCLEIVFVSLVFADADCNPMIYYEDCDYVKITPGNNVDLLIFSVLNTHTIMVMPYVSIHQSLDVDTC